MDVLRHSGLPVVVDRPDPAHHHHHDHDHDHGSSRR
jgi:hypothetical protein